MGVPRGRLAAIFLRVGNLTFGGGDPAMAALQRELVENRRWLSPDQYALVYSLARVTPGTNILAFCAGSGWLLAGAGGALLAALSACLPAAVLSYWLTVAEEQWRTHPLVAAGMRGVVSTVAGLMLAGAALLLKPAWRSAPRVRARALVFALGAGLSALSGAAPVLVLGAAAAFGWWLGPAPEPKAPSPSATQPPPSA